MWFEQLTGFTEQGAAQVRQMLTLENGVLTSRANGKAFQIGHLVTPILAHLKVEAAAIMQSATFIAKPISVQEVIADVQSLHMAPQNAGAFFQLPS